MKIQLSEHFTLGKLMRFVLPSIFMMIFTSVYSVVDGLFVSNYVGKTSFAAVNFIMPLLMLLGAPGFMIGTGGSAIVAKSLGEGKSAEASKYFSFLVYASAALSVLILLLGQLFLGPAAVLLGAKGRALAECVAYGRIIIAALPAFMLQNVFQSFLITAERPKIGLGITVAAGVANMLLDFLFVAVLNFGIRGAALATVLSQCIGGIAPVIYLAVQKNCPLHFTRAGLYPRILLRTCANGSSELMTNVSSSVVGMLYNASLMKHAGENGVAAYGVIMYVSFIFAAVFIGYSVGTAPIISYHYGAANRPELKNLLKKSLAFTGAGGVAMTAASVLLARPLAGIFVGYDAELLSMTVRGMIIFSLSFLVMGFNIFSSGFFTALNNGLVSAVISFMRTLVFQVLVITTLPLIFKLDGIWFAMVVAELLSFAVSAYFVVSRRRQYGYGG